ncbi:MAG TPA: hypothetical protein VK970_11245 [Candidatus Methylacidiphilales bacterium]|nr:hypothetical protein [Candidatus Methylacidiphilales bacterium]
MDLAVFLTELLERGVARVSTGFFTTPLHDADAERVIADLDFFARANCPGKAPELDPTAALWAAAILYRACQFLHIRDLGTDVIVPAMQERCPRPVDAPSTTYSVDLVLRFLPDLLRMASRLSPEDPLVALLKNLAREWPLSSIGAADVPGPMKLTSILAHPALAALYRDRVIEFEDESRLADDRVRAAVRAALGGHPELCPALAKTLELPSTPPAIANA